MNSGTISQYPYFQTAARQGIEERIIPTLLIENEGLIKGVQFKGHRYVGDPLNAVSIFSEKEVDEIVILDRSAAKQGINFKLIERIASQAFMPLAYGGGINSVADAQQLLRSGVEKVILNSITYKNPGLVQQIAATFGGSSTVVAIDVKTSFLGKSKCFAHNATTDTGKDVLSHALQMEEAGAGEILLTSVNHEGTMKGYDLKLIRTVADALSIPVIANGGGGNVAHFKDALQEGASAVAIGSMCVFWGKHKAVLINYPGRGDVL